MHQHHLLEAVGVALLNSLWQFALIWLVYVAISQLFILNSARRFVLGAGIYLMGFIFFLLTVFMAYQRLLSQSTSETFAFFRLPGAGLPAWLASSNYLSVLSGIYLCIFIVLLAKWVGAYQQLKILKSNPVIEIDEHWQSFLKKASARLNISKKVSLYLSPSLSTPLTIGFLKPVIFLPLGCFTYLSPSQIEALILHELAHIRRYDYLLNFFILFIDTALFFNPFARLLAKQLRSERENCCDDWVLKFNYNRIAYASALLQLARFCDAKPSFALKAVGKNNYLLVRIRRITENKPGALLRLNNVPGLLVMTLVVLMAIIIAFSPSVRRQEKKDLVSRFDMDLKMSMLTAEENLSIVQAPANKPKINGQTVAKAPDVATENVQREVLGIEQVTAIQPKMPVRSASFVTEASKVVKPRVVAAELILVAEPDVIERKKIELEDVLQKLHKMQVTTNITQENLSRLLQHAGNTISDSAVAEVEKLAAMAENTNDFAIKLDAAIDFVVGQYELLKEQSRFTTVFKGENDLQLIDSLNDESRRGLNVVREALPAGPRKKLLPIPQLPSTENFPIVPTPRLKTIKL